MVTIIRDLGRGRTILRPGGYDRTCRQCDAVVFFARNEHDVTEWIRFDDAEYTREHACWRSSSQGRAPMASAVAPQAAAPLVLERRSTAANPIAVSPIAASGKRSRFRLTVPYAPTSLQALIDRGGAGKTLEVAAGTSTGPATARAPLTLDGGTRAPVFVGEYGTALTVIDCEVEIRGITFRAGGDAIRVQASAGRRAGVHLRNCTVDAARGGIVAAGRDVRVRLTDCYVSAGTGAALSLSSGNKGMVSGSLIVSAQAVGIRGDENVTIDISDSSVAECGGPGIALGSGAKVFSDNPKAVTIADNRGSGICVGERSEVRIHGAEIRRNAGYGIEAKDAVLEFVRCVIADNPKGRYDCVGACEITDRSLTVVPTPSPVVPPAPPVFPLLVDPVTSVSPPEPSTMPSLGDPAALRRLLADPAPASITLDDPRFRWVRSWPGIDSAATRLADVLAAFDPDALTPDQAERLDDLTEYIDWLRFLPLDQELESIVVPLAPEDDVVPALAVFGWSGRAPSTVQEAAVRADRSTQQVSGAIHDVIAAFDAGPVWTPTLDRVVTALAKAAPVRGEELDGILTDIGGIALTGWSIEGLLRAQRLASVTVRLESTERDGEVLVTRRDQVLPQEIKHPVLPVPPLDWLDPEIGRIAERRLRKVLAVARSVTLEDACEQLGRGTIAPIDVTPGQVRALVDTTEWARVDGDIVHANAPLPIEEILTRTEVTLVELIQQGRTGPDRSFLAAEILPGALAAGMSRERTYQLLSNSPLLRRLDRGRYELVAPVAGEDEIEPGFDETGPTRVDPHSRATHFATTGYALGELVDLIDQGVVGLPDLQRPFVWKTDRIRDLFDSMYRGYPIGYLLLWDNPIPTAGRSFGARAEDGGEQVVPTHLVVDGQQRLTSLWATLTGKAVINADFERQEIRLAFDPIEGQFIVATDRTARNPRYLPDIRPLLTAGADTDAICRTYLDRLGVALALPDEQRETIAASFHRLARLRDFPLTGLVLSSHLDVQQVAEVFVRINSKGVRLDQGDFILTLMSVYWEEGRRQLEAFCRSAQADVAGVKTARNPYITPRPTQLLTVAVSLAFRNARLKETHAVIGGEETGPDGTSVRDERFQRLADAQTYLLDLTNWHDFFSAVRRAGYVSGDMVTSEVALLYAYAFFLIGRRDYGVPQARLSRVIARWFMMASMTARYTAGANTKMDNDLAQLRGATTADHFVAVLEREIASVLTPDYWAITLPNQLITTSTSHLAVRAYDASLVAAGAPALFGRRSVGRLFEPDLPKTERGVRRVPLFSRQHLERNGAGDAADAKQVANLAIADEAGMPDDMKVAPADYLAGVGRPGSDRELGTADRQHALPNGWPTLPYDAFLAARRAGMAQVIREHLDALASGV